MLCFLVAFPLIFFLFDRNGSPPRQVTESFAQSANRAVVRAQLVSKCYLKLFGKALFFSLAPVR